MIFWTKTSSIIEVVYSGGKACRAALIYTEKTRKDPKRPEKTHLFIPKRPEKTHLFIPKRPEKTHLFIPKRPEKTREDPKRLEKTRKDPKRHPKRPKTRKDIFIVDVTSVEMTRVMLIVFEH